MWHPPLRAIHRSACFVTNLWRTRAVSTDSKFECDKCGLCCRCLRHNATVKGTRLEKMDRGDGVCKHLTADNLCDIYDHRPDICNVDKTYDMEFADKMSREEYHTMQRNACEVIRKTFAARNKERFGL